MVSVFLGIYGARKENPLGLLMTLYLAHYQDHSIKSNGVLNFIKTLLLSKWNLISMNIIT